MTADSSMSLLLAQMPMPSARDRVVDVLQKRFVDDQLSIADFEQRLRLAHQARSIAELDALLADLSPSELRKFAEPSASSGPGSFSSHQGAASGRIVTILSNNERHGPMPLPRRLEVVSIVGNVELDLRDATFLSGITEIDVSAVLGNVELTLPIGIRVESTGNAFLGNFEHRSEVTSHEDPQRMIRITGKSFMGSVKIESAPPSLGGAAELAAHSPRRFT